MIHECNFINFIFVDTVATYMKKLRNTNRMEREGAVGIPRNGHEFRCYACNL